LHTARTADGGTCDMAYFLCERNDLQSSMLFITLMTTFWSDGDVMFLDATLFIDS
jgi:hypothetical protein